MESKFDWLKIRNFPALFSLTLFITMMAAGYYYNLIIFQTGLEVFVTRR